VRASAPEGFHALAFHSTDQRPWSYQNKNPASRRGSVFLDL